MADVPAVDVVDGLPTGGTGTVQTLSTVTDRLGATDSTAAANPAATAALNAILKGMWTILDEIAADIGDIASTSSITQAKLTDIDARDEIIENLTTPVSTADRAIVNVGSTVTRPANTTAYAADDAVSNNATAGSVTPITFTNVSETNDVPVSIDRARIDSIDTGVAGKSFRLWLYSSDPTASTGIVGGDNAAFSVKKAGFLGVMEGTFRAFSDGSRALLVVPSDEGARVIALPLSGGKNLFGLLQTLDAYTPSANSTTFIVTLEGFQFRA